MRYPPDDATEQSARRRRGQHSGPHSGPQEVSRDGSVFVPGYASRRTPGPDAGDPGRDAAPRWQGSAAGKGPVRGYPPLPGQPPPMYPPGQFAAWNRRGPGRGPGQPGPGASGAADSDRHQLAAADPGHPGETGYYGRDAGGHTDPGYSTLAVSDPAADVTSTQTWQAVGDGQATGTWTAPERPADPPPGGPGQLPGGPGQPPGGPGQLPGGPGQPRADASGRRLAPWSPQAAALRPGGTGQLSRESGRHSSQPPGPARDSGPHDTSSQPPGPARGSGPHVRSAGPVDRAALRQDRPAGPLGGPGGRPDAEPGRAGRRGTRSGRAGTAPAAAAAAAGAGTAIGTAPAGRRTGRPSAPRSGRSGPARRGKHPASAKLAIAGALAIVLIAGIALYVGARAASQRPSAAGQQKTTPSATAAPASPSPSPGTYGYIGSRRGDPTPLTVTELYPATFAASGVEYTLTRSRLSKDCVDAVNGANIQSAVSSGSCSQVVRATYLASKTGMMGTIGVLNLATAKEAAKAAKAAGAQNFIVQLAGRKAPTSKIGHGPGLEEALAKGHYLILIWAELTTLKTPHKGAQRTGLAHFMTDLFDSTANVTLTDRMISGSPAPSPSAG